MAFDFHSIATDVLLDQDDLMTEESSDHLSDEERAGMMIVTDADWETMAQDLASYLDEAAREWVWDNIKSKTDA